MGPMDWILGGAQALMYFDQQNKAEKATAAQRAAAGGLLGLNMDTGALSLNQGFFGNLLSQSRDQGRATNEALYDTIGMQDNLASQYKQRENRLLGMAERLGDVERKDLRSAYQTAFKNSTANLAGSGLQNTTVAANLQGGVSRDYGQALGRTEERLRRERLGLATGLSADTLGAQQNAISNRQNVAGMQDTVNARLSNQGMQLGSMALNTITGQQIQYPQFGPTDYFMSLRAAEAAKPEEPNWFESMFAPAAAGAGTQLGTNALMNTFPIFAPL